MLTRRGRDSLCRDRPGVPRRP